MSDPYVAFEPDTKDWTWVITQPCPECGFVAEDVAVDALGAGIRSATRRFLPALAAHADVRPDPTTWSPLEYGAQLRDVHRIFADRVRSMLDTVDPHFANWDQDATAVEDRYDLQDPATVAGELGQAAETVAALYDGVAGDSWSRRGFRSNGSVFTVESIGRYHLHDAVHHLWDVTGEAWESDAGH